MKPKTGLAQVNVELPPEFLDAFKKWSKERGESLRESIYHAMRRHLTHPPPPAEPIPWTELPAEPFADTPPPAPKGKRRKTAE